MCMAVYCQLQTNAVSKILARVPLFDYYVSDRADPVGVNDVDGL